MLCPARELNGQVYVSRRNLYAVVALSSDTNSTGRSFQVMAQSAVDKIPPGPILDALTAEKVFGKIVRRKVARKNGEWLNLHIMRKHFLTIVGVNVQVP
jgi:hypothetical protein